VSELLNSATRAFATSLIKKLVPHFGHTLSVSATPRRSYGPASRKS